MIFPCVDCLFLSSSPLHSTEYRVLESVFNILHPSTSESRVSILSTLDSSLLSISSTFFLVIRSRRIVVHSPLSLCAPFIILAVLLRKPVIGIIWDAYPWSSSPVLTKHFTVTVRILNILEPILFAFCKRKIVPSSDFLSYSPLSSSIACPVWPLPPSCWNESSDLVLSCTSPACDVKERITIVFAGQIHPTRGLELAIKRLNHICTFPFRLLIFSSTPCPSYILDDPLIEFCGYRTRDKLLEIMRECDVALVSLSPLFSSPAFPSKTFDYLAADLPILYYGPKLPFYTGLLTAAQIGFDTSLISELSLTDIANLKRDFLKKKKSYLDSVCISSRHANLLSTIILC